MFILRKEILVNKSNKKGALNLICPNVTMVNRERRNERKEEKEKRSTSNEFDLFSLLIKSWSTIEETNRTGNQPTLNQQIKSKSIIENDFIDFRIDQHFR